MLCKQAKLGGGRSKAADLRCSLTHRSVQLHRSAGLHPRQRLSARVPEGRNQQEGSAWQQANNGSQCQVSPCAGHLWA